METLPKFGISRADMMRRVARFSELKGSDGGLPDSKAPQCERTLYNVIGFQPPKDSGGAVTSSVGDDASRLSAIPISEGFNLGYCRAKPGKGPMMHNHDTNETFIPMTGIWRCSWGNEKARSNRLILAVVTSLISAMNWRRLMRFLHADSPALHATLSSCV
jgi:hypothetical protein